MSSPSPNERSGNGLNDNHNDQTNFHNSDTLQTPNSSSNSRLYSTSASNDGLSLTNSLRDAGLGVGGSGIAETTAGSDSSHGYNLTIDNLVNSDHSGASSSSETSGTTAASGSAATGTVPSNPEAVANATVNPTLSSSTNHPPPSAPGRARNGNPNFLFTYRDGRLVPVPRGMFCTY